MSDEIISKLGFDVSQALRALDNLDTKMKMVGETMKRFGEVAKASSAAASALDKVGRASKGVDDAKRSVDSLTVSWSMMGRIVTTQLIVRALSQLRRTFEDTAASAVDFQRQVALIRTIDDSGASFDRVSTAIRKLSDTYNIGLSDATAGTYQAISNQVGNFAESLEFTARAAQFAKATNSSLKDSVDLLSGAMASYGLGVEDTEKVSGLFFSVIDKGRISAAELANSFGRLGPLAAQAGVSLEDLGAALSAISVKGSKTGETLTMVRGVLNTLAKPTPELTDRLNKLGFSSVEAAMATLHLDGVLHELTKTAQTSQDLAKLFPDVRARAGAASLISDFKTLAENIEAMREAGADFAREKWLTATATDAEKVTAEINKLENAMTVDLGQAILKSARDLSEWIGGADNLIQIAESCGPVLLGLGGGFVALRASILAAKLEAAGLAKMLGALALVPVAAGVGSSIGQYIGGEISEEAFSNLKKVDEANTKSLEAFKRAQSEKRGAANKADEAIVQSALKTIQELNKTYLADVANAKRANDASTKNAEAGFSRILNVRQRLVNELAKAGAESAEIVRASDDRISNLTGKSADRQFSFSISPLDDARQAVALATRARKIASKAGQELATATSAEAIARALQEFSRAESFGEQAATSAERTGERSMEANAARALQDVTRKQIESERKLQALQAARMANLEKERSKQAAVVEQMRSAIQVALDNTKVFDQQGKLLPQEDLAKQAAARQEALRKIASLALTSKDLDATKALGLADFVNRFSADLQREPIRLAFSVEEGIAEAQADVQAAFDQFKVGFNLAPLEATLGKQFSTPDEAARGLVEAKQRAAELRAEFDKAMASREGAERQMATTADAVSASLDRIAERLKKQGEDPATLAAVNAFREALADPGLTPAKLQELAGAVQPLVDKLGLLNWGGVWNVQNVNDFSVALSAMLQRAEAIKTLQMPTPDTSRLQEALQQIGPNISAGVLPSAALADNLERAARAASQIGVPTAGYALGGPIYRAAGGPAGTDTVPAMLSPGEVVMNAVASNRFASQLVAMNAGVQPVYRSEGGSVTNIGDIVVHAANKPEQTAREVMNTIRRELRRGTGRL